MNSMNDEKSGFGFDTNQISIIKKDFTRKTFPLKPKRKLPKILCLKSFFALMNMRKVSDWTFMSQLIFDHIDYLLQFAEQY